MHWFFAPTHWWELLLIYLSFYVAGYHSKKIETWIRLPWWTTAGIVTRVARKVALREQSGRPEIFMSAIFIYGLFDVCGSVNGVKFLWRMYARFKKEGGLSRMRKRS